MNNHYHHYHHYRSFIRICFAALAALALAGCQTTKKDIVLSGPDEKAYGSLEAIEETVVRLDGAGADREGIARARREISSLQGTVADGEFQAGLAAFSGRLYLMEGRSAEALGEYRRAEGLSARNLAARILSFRLERADLARRLAMIDAGIQSEGPLGELLAERGRALFDMNRFAESVAAFDAAFNALSEKPYYAESYAVFRNKAWELKDLSQGGRTMEIASQGEITWRDLIEITRTETEYLRFITAGRDWPAQALFTALVERAFIPPTQDTRLTAWPYTNPASTETVLRGGAAWFLWHLHAENRANRGLLTRYSSRYTNTPNARSPIGDVDLTSPFIDSVLGCVESEFMSLPDGRNFMPGERVRGAEYLSMLKKL